MTQGEYQHVVQKKMPKMFFERALQLAFKHTRGTAEELLLPENAEALVKNTKDYVDLWLAFEKGLDEGGPQHIQDADSLLRALTLAGVTGDTAQSAWRTLAQDDAVTFEAFAEHVRSRHRPTHAQPAAEV